VAAGAFEALGVSTVMPAASAELHGLRYYGLVFSAFMLAQLVGVVVGGLQADRSSPERPYLVGTIVFSIGLLITGTAHSMLVMALGRGVQGLGAGAVGGLSVYAIRRCYDDSARPQLIALMSTAFMVPGLLGPSLAAGINALVGWRWVFLGLVPAMPAAALMVIPVLRLTAAEEADSESASQPRIVVAVLSAGVALGLVALAATSTAVRIAAGIPACLLGIYSLGKVFPRGAARLKSGQPAAVAFIVWAAVAYYSIEAFLPLALTAIHGTSIGQAGLALSGGTALWNLGTWIQARLVKRIGGPRLLAAGAPVLLAGVASTGLVMTTAGFPFVLVILSWAVVTLGMGLTSSTAMLVVIDHATEGTEGRVSSAAQLATLVGGAVATGLAGLRISSAEHDSAALAGDIRVVAVIATGAAVIGVLASLRSGMRKKQ
jgi:MFS family permease